MEKIISLIIILVIGKSHLSASGPTVTTNKGSIEGLTKQINGKSIDYFLVSEF